MVFLRDGQISVEGASAAAINWGFVKGKTQAWLLWDSWTHPYVLQQPTIWFHDVSYPDVKPCHQHEIDLIRTLTTQRNGDPNP